MIKLFSLSFFTRLYLTIAIAVIVSGAMTFFVIESLDEQNQIDEFVYFTDHVYSTLVKEKKIDPDKQHQDLTQPKQFIDTFSLNWQLIPENTLLCVDCEFVGRSGSADVYRNSFDQFIAVYSLPSSKAWLVIDEAELLIFEGTKIVESPEQIQEEYFIGFSFDDIAPILLLFIVLVTIASAIYWPIRTLQRQIERLIETQRQFGDGDLQIRASEKLSKPLNELAASFNSMANSIKDTVNENQIFAQAVPHEVRTPLSRIQLAAGLLRKSNDLTQQFELLDNIDTYIDDINRLISQVVAFSKLNSVSVESELDFYQPIELSAFIESRIKATKCEEKLKVVRKIKGPIQLKTNPAYLRLLIDNLLKNASIYGKAEIVVSLKESSDKIELVVEDDGDGIPQESFDTVFIPFSRLDVSRSRKTGGLGLGLAISKAACNRMNCELTVENSPNGGAVFNCVFIK